MMNKRNTRSTGAYKLRMEKDCYYVWCAGSCDYGHKDRYSGGAYITQHNEETIERYHISEPHTTEFRMILTAMIHAMEMIPEGARIVFVTNVSYILQNWDKIPTDTSANADLIKACIALKDRHHTVSVKVVPFHKYALMTSTHELARQAMLGKRKSMPSSATRTSCIHASNGTMDIGLHCRH